MFSHPFSIRSHLCCLLFGTLVAFSAPAPAEIPAITHPAKFEPAQGCYIGAFIENDFTVQGDINAFEELTKKKHASYFTYVGYGRPFPLAWVQKVRARNAVPHIAFEPNDGLANVNDDAYLRAWARDAARTQYPIFLRWASEMNGPWTAYGRDPELYKEKFRLVSRIMKEEAPNVAMVWTPFAEPARLMGNYYPGDDWVDWVGVNIYSVYVNNGNPLLRSDQKDPVAALRFVYDNYATTKPIHISEYAATIYCKGTGSETVDFAIGKMTQFYESLIREFPRVKSVNWFCWDTIRAKKANNNYSLLDDGRVLATYRKLVSDQHFLSRVMYNPAEFSHSVRPGTTLGPRGIVLAGGKVDTAEMLTGNGAIAATLDQPFLRGLENGTIVRGDLDLRVQLPLDMKPRGLMWQVDGRTVALTNTSPYRVSIPRERLGAGKHTVRVVALTDDLTDTKNASPEVEIEVVE